MIVVKMAEEEAGREYNTRDETVALKQRFQALVVSLKDNTDSPLDASAGFCHEFCQVCVTVVFLYVRHHRGERERERERR